MASLGEARWARSPTLAEEVLVGRGRRGERGQGVGMTWGRVWGWNEYGHKTLYENLKKSIKTLLRNKLAGKFVAQ